MNVIGSSFRDPCGQLFYENGKLYRRVSYKYKEHYDFLINSGLYQRLVDIGLLIPHKEAEGEGEVYKVLEPDIVKYIFYPYEWCFSQLKDAALTTLEIENIALKFGMTLKDSSAYNIQFCDGHPILIDTLSFEIYQEGKPWIAYRQFCQHFLAPLALMAYKDIRLSQLLRVHIDGVPLDLACSLLPFHAKLNSGLAMHLFAHAKSQLYYAEDKKVVKGVSRYGMEALIDNLRSCVNKLEWDVSDKWDDYYKKNNYSAEAVNHKKVIVNNMIGKISAKSILDLGSNTGLFSRLASVRDIEVVSVDCDPVCVELNYQKSKGNPLILPLVVDITNPSSGIGWDNNERIPFVDRIKVDTVLALALIHHLAITNNIQLDMIARVLRKYGKSLIIEFVPKEDSQVQKMLVNREDIFDNYNRECFENVFSMYYEICERVDIKDSKRSIYLMIGKDML